MEVSPDTRIHNLIGWRHWAAKNRHLALFWVNKWPKRTQTKINLWEAMCTG